MLHSIVSQHASEAASLWHLRWRAGTAPHLKRADLWRLNERVEAHLDGLRVAGEGAWPIIQEQLEGLMDAGAAFVAASVAYSQSHAARIQSLLAMAEENAEVAQGIAGALIWLPVSIVGKPILDLAHGNSLSQRHIGLDAALGHRLNPGMALEKALFDKDLSLRVKALRYSGIMGYAVWAKQLKAELKSPDLGCRAAAAWSLARLTSDTAALSELQTIALTEPRYRISSLNILLRRLDELTARRLIALLQKTPGAERLALFALGVWGDPAELPHLLAALKDVKLARLAGEAFSTITGVDLASQQMETSIPEDHEPTPNDDPLDDRVELDPDENLPWPATDRVETWWKKQRGRFQEGQRYFLGLPLTVENYQKAVVEGYQRQRAQAALELGLRQTGLPLEKVTVAQPQ